MSAIACDGSFNEPICTPGFLVGSGCLFYRDFEPFLTCLDPRKNARKVNVRGKSFRAVNDLLAEGQKLTAMDYILLRIGIEFTLGEDVPDGTWVCIFKAIQNGFPLAHDFGTWSETEGRLVNRRPHVWEKCI